MSTKTDLVEMVWNCCVIALLVCILQALSYFWLVSLYNFKLDITRSLHCSGCFDVGVGFTALGVFLMLFQECGLTFGTMCTLASIIFMLENMKSVEKNTNTIESGLGALLVPTLGCLLFIGKAFKSVGGVQGQEPQDEADNVHMKSEHRRVENKEKTPTKLTKAWTFIWSQAKNLITLFLLGPCFMALSLAAFLWKSFVGALTFISSFWTQVRRLTTTSLWGPLGTKAWTFIWSQAKNLITLFLLGPCFMALSLAAFLWKSFVGALTFISSFWNCPTDNASARELPAVLLNLKIIMLSSVYVVIPDLLQWISAAFVSASTAVSRNIQTQVKRLTTTSLWGPFKKAGALLAIFTCSVLTYTMASRESVLLALMFVALQVLSCFWLLSLFNLTTYSKNFSRFFFFGVGGTVLGPFMLFIPLTGFILFCLFYSAGTVCTLTCTLFLTRQTSSIEHAVTRLIKWIKTKVGAIDPDAAKWETYSDIYDSDIGGIAEGLCVLLFPVLGLLLGIVHVVMWAVGLGGQKKKTPPVKDATKQQGQGNETDTELDEFQHMVMKVLRFVILGAVLWFWGFALFLWTSSCLLFGVFHCLHHKSANIGFIVCFLIGAFCTVLGVYLLDQPESGLTLFSVFYTVGNLCVLGSTLFVIELWEQLKMAFDRVRAVSCSVMILCLILTIFAGLWWKSFIVALTFCFLHILSSIWYCLTYVQYSRRIFTFLELTKED